jgi:hypothetical protein
MPTAKYGRQQNMSFRENSPKCRQNGEKFVKKGVERVKIPHLCPIDSRNSVVETNQQQY